MNEDIESHLDEIQRHVRVLKGEENEDISPWDFRMPSRGDLRSMRMECGLTQEEVANKLDYSTVHVTQVENGHHAPSREYLESILLLFKREWNQ